MSEPPALVAFDLDDTLYLECTYVRSGFEAVSHYVQEMWGISGFAEESWCLFEQGVRGKVFDLALSRLGADTFLPQVDELVQVYRGHTPNLSLSPDASEILAFLHPRCRLAIISDGAFVSQEKKVEALGLRNLVNTIVLTGEQGEEYSKPSPWGYREVERRTGIPGTECAYIGDNPVKDFMGAKGLGWRTVRVRRPGGLHVRVQAVLSHGPDFEVRDLREAVARLGFSFPGDKTKL